MSWKRSFLHDSLVLYHQVNIQMQFCCKHFLLLCNDHKVFLSILTFKPFIYSVEMTHSYGSGVTFVLIQKSEIPTWFGNLCVNVKKHKSLKFHPEYCWLRELHHFSFKQWQIWAIRMMLKRQGPVRVVHIANTETEADSTSSRCWSSYKNSWNEQKIIQP